MTAFLVFKTSIRSPEAVRQAELLLCDLLPENIRWNFDLEDVENILRVEHTVLGPERIIAALSLAGFDCAELED